MPDALIDPTTQTDRAYLRLRDEILHGALMPGDRLSAAALQDRFGEAVADVAAPLVRSATITTIKAAAKLRAACAKAVPARPQCSGQATKPPTLLASQI